MTTTLKHLTEEFLMELRRRNYSPHTVSAYRLDLAQFVRFLRHNTPHDPRLEDFTKRSAEAFARELAGKGRATSSISRKICVLRSFGDHLAKSRHLRESPVADVRGPKIVKHNPTVLTETETRTVLEALPQGTLLEVRDAAIIELLYGSGVRVSELTGANVGDFRDGELKVLGKGGKERIVPTGRLAAEVLGAYLEARGTVTRDEPLFLNCRGGRLTPRSVQRMLRARIDLEMKVSPHVFRHSCATHMLDKGADVRDIQVLLGHASLTTTQIYTHTSTAHLKRVHERAHPRGGRAPCEPSERGDRS